MLGHSAFAALLVSTFAAESYILQATSNILLPDGGITNTKEIIRFNAMSDGRNESAIHSTTRGGVASVRYVNCTTDGKFSTLSVVHKGNMTACYHGRSRPMCGGMLGLLDKSVVTVDTCHTDLGVGQWRNFTQGSLRKDLCLMRNNHWEFLRALVTKDKYRALTTILAGQYAAGPLAPIDVHAEFCKRPTTFEEAVEKLGDIVETAESHFEALEAFGGVY